MKNISIELISGVGALGLSYHTCPYWKRKDGRPRLHLSLWFAKALIYLPYTHCEKIGRGSAVDSYGVFWWPKVDLKPKLFWK